MLKIKNYVKVNSLEEAYELNQKKNGENPGRNGVDENGKPKSDHCH